MTTKECFEQYRHMAEEVEQLQKNARKKVSDTVRGSEAEAPYLKRTFTVEGISDRKDHKTISRIRVLQERMADVEETIEDVDDSKLRPALEMKYVDGLTWREVAQRMGDSEEAVRKRIKRFFEKNF